MKRPSISLAVFVAALTTTTLTFNTTTQADGPWTYASKLNPRTWFQKSDGASAKGKESEVTRTKDSDSVTVTRRHLDDDPFRLQAIGDSAVANPADSPAKRRVSEASPDAPAEKREADTPKPKVAKSSVGRNTKTPAAKNQFVDEFDSDFARLVDSVRAEREAQPEVAPEVPVAPSSRSVAKSDAVGKQSVAKQMPASKAPLMPDLDPQDSTSGVAAAVPTEKRLLVRTSERLPSKTTVTDESVAAIGETEVAESRSIESGPTSPEISRTNDANSFEELVSGGRKEMDTPLSRVVRNERDLVSATVPAKPEVKKRSDAAPKVPQTASLPALVKSDRGAAGRVRKSDDSPVRLLSPIDASGLIVSNDQVPDRKLYTATRSFVSSRVQSPSSEISRTGSFSGDQSLAKSSPIPTQTEPSVADQADERANVVILPSVKRSSGLPAAAATATAGVSGNRVSSNKAPVRVVPDGIAVQRLSHEEIAAAPIESRLPLMSLGAPAKAPSEDGPLFILPGTDRGTASVTGELPADSETASAPKLIWPDENLVRQPAKSRSRLWVPGLLLMSAIGAAIGLTIHRKRQLAAVADVVVVSSGEKPAR